MASQTTVFPSWAFCFKYKGLATTAHWSSLVQVDRSGWDSAETLVPITQPHEGVGVGGRYGGAFCSDNFFIVR